MGDDPVKLINVSGKYILSPGDSFNSFEELRERMDAVARNNFLYYWLRDSRTVAGAHMKTSRPIAQRLKYYTMRYACIYGGQKHKRSTNRCNVQHQQRQQSIRNDCPAYVMLRASKCGEKLLVISVCNLHNHEISEESVQNLPHKRRLSPEVRVEIQNLILMKLDRNLIIEYVKLKYGKEITKKDLSNISASSKTIKDRSGIDESTSKKLLESIEYYFCNVSIDGSETNGELSQNIDFTCHNVDEIESSVDDLIEYIPQGNVIEDPTNKSILNNYMTHHDYNSSDSNSYEIVPSTSDTDVNNLISISEFHNKDDDDDNEMINVYFENETTLNDFIVVKDEETSQIDDDHNNVVDTQMHQNYDSVDTNDTLIAEGVMKRKVTPKRRKTSYLKWQRQKIRKCRTCGTNANTLHSEIKRMRSLKIKLKEQIKRLKLQKFKMLKECNNSNL